MTSVIYNGVAEMIAAQFHATYESLAPAFQYNTRKSSAVTWENVPEKNRQLMTATVQSLLNQKVISVPFPGTAAKTPTNETEKAYGGCHNCYGKGYSTGAELYAAKGKQWGEHNKMKYCSCNRGKQLEMAVAQQTVAARIDEVSKIAAATAELKPRETWKEWSFRVSVYLEGRLQSLKTPPQKGNE